MPKKKSIKKGKGMSPYTPSGKSASKPGKQLKGNR